MKISCTVFDYHGNKIDEVESLDASINPVTGSISGSFPPSKEGYSFRIKITQRGIGKKIKLQSISCK